MADAPPEALVRTAAGKVGVVVSKNDDGTFTVRLTKTGAVVRTPSITVVWLNDEIARWNSNPDNNALNRHLSTVIKYTDITQVTAGALWDDFCKVKPTMPITLMLRALILLQCVDIPRMVDTLYRIMMHDRATPLIIIHQEVGTKLLKKAMWASLPAAKIAEAIAGTTFPTPAAFERSLDQMDQCGHYLKFVSDKISRNRAGAVKEGARVVWPKRPLQLSRVQKWAVGEQTRTLMVTTRWPSHQFAVTRGMSVVDVVEAIRSTSSDPSQFVLMTPPQPGIDGAMHTIIGFNGVDVTGADVSGVFDPTMAQIDAAGWVATGSTETGRVVVFPGTLSATELAAKVSAERQYGPFAWYGGYIHRIRDRAAAADAPITMVAEGGTTFTTPAILPEAKAAIAAVMENKTVARAGTCALPKCDKPGVKTCARCRIARYCCREHQKGDWKRHKKECVPATTSKTAMFAEWVIPQ